MIWVALHLLIVAACGVRILLRPHREPAARVAWLAILLALPAIGVLSYLLLGETNPGRKRVERQRRALTSLPAPDGAPGWPAAIPNDVVPDNYAGLFDVGRSISSYAAVGGNSAALMADSDAAIDRMIADIDAATRHVHLLFYIWLPDNNGGKMVAAMIRAAARGVVCRVMVDDLGSHELIRSRHWAEMRAAGVHLVRALQIGNPLLRMLFGRIDLRNHRKILVIDNRVTYCGSQNCADPAFLPKAKFAPWVDAVMRFEGPVVRQNQHLFATDWLAGCDDDIGAVLLEPLESAAATQSGFPAQVVASGPTLRVSAIPEMFASLMYAAQKELVLTTPYYVPNGAIQGALCAAGNRGIEVTLVVPARNDDFAVGATSRSYYEDLLTAGVRIFEYQHGLLHTKSVTVDGVVTFIGSANMDRRSFELNYENNILLCDAAVTGEMRARQAEYIAASRVVTLDEVQAWTWRRRLWGNLLATFSPVL